MDPLKVVEYIKAIDTDRRNEWIAHSYKLKEVDELFELPYQGLATVDARLVVEDSKIIAGTPSNPFGDLSDHLTQSYLWVLGAYEIIRTLSQLADSGSGNKYGSKKDDIRVVKHEFEKVRIPLAKFEAAKRNPGGYTFAYPVIDRQLGVGWLIGNNTYVSRKLLSDMFLKLIKELP